MGKSLQRSAYEISDFQRFLRSATPLVLWWNKHSWPFVWYCMMKKNNTPTHLLCVNFEYCSDPLNFFYTNLFFSKMSCILGHFSLRFSTSKPILLRVSPRGRKIKLCFPHTKRRKKISAKIHIFGTFEEENIVGNSKFQFSRSRMSKI